MERFSLSLILEGVPKNSLTIRRFAEERRDFKLALFGIG